MAGAPIPADFSPSREALEVADSEVAVLAAVPAVDLVDLVAAAVSAAAVRPVVGNPVESPSFNRYQYFARRCKLYKTALSRDFFGLNI